MKKWIALFLAPALALSLSVTVFAAEITEQNGSPTSADAEITTSIKPTYSVTIPQSMSVEFNAVSTDFGTIQLNTAQIEPDYAVKVELTASGTLKNEADADKNIPYVIRIKGTEEAFTFGEYQNIGDSTDLTIDITQEAWDAAYAGDYADTVTFTISYGKATP